MDTRILEQLEESFAQEITFVQHRSKDIHTLFGWITVKRAYYYCPACGSTLAPYDKASGLGSTQLSPGLAKACCLLAVDDSFEQSSRKIEALTGQKVSDNTIERVVYQAGSVAQEQQNQQLQRFFEHKEIPESQTKPERLSAPRRGRGSLLLAIGDWIGGGFWGSWRRKMGGFGGRERV